MFNKKVCNNCGEKINSKSNFCSNCGFNLGGSSRDDYGILGRNDSFSNLGDDNLRGGIFGGLGGGMFDRMLNSAVKMLEKEIQRDMKNSNRQRDHNSSFELFVNGKRITPQSEKGAGRNVRQEKVKKLNLPTFSEDKRKKFQSFSREEPKINLKRYPDSLVYEIGVPGVSSDENISILKLENSVEIRAVGKDKSYFKILQVGLPLIDYSLSRGVLLLKFKS